MPIIWNIYGNEFIILIGMNLIDPMSLMCFFFVTIS